MKADKRAERRERVAESFGSSNALIDSISAGVPSALVEVSTQGRTLKHRAPDVLAHFDRPGT